MRVRTFGPMSRTRPAALYVLDREAADLIYGPTQRAAISELVDVVAPPLTSGELASRLDLLAGVEVLLSGWGAPLLDEALLAHAPDLGVVLYGAGAVRGFVTDELFRRGVRVSSANAANAVPVAELTLAVILFSLKHGWRLARQVVGPDDPRRQEVPGAYGETVGLLGLGAVGRLVCERLASFDLDIVAYDPYCTEEEAADLGISLVGLDELFARAAVVSVHAPLYPATTGLVSGELVDSMRPGATLVNTARGAILRQEEVAAVLAARQDLEAFLDVTDPEPLPAGHPLLELPNVTITPHLAGSLGPECRRLGDTMVAELRRYVDGQPLLHQVDPAALAVSATR
jgi:phosphoglycerate dehydrogenase-like enzyme